MITETVKTRVINWAAEVRKEWGEEWNKPEIAYEFSNDRKFEDTGDNNGVYQKGS